jgi:hypothetical protein
MLSYSNVLATIAAGLATNAAVSITPGYCQGTVMFVHT